MTPTLYAPEDPNDTAGRRAILARMRAMDADNDNEPSVRLAHSSSPRHRRWQEALAPLLQWRRLRELAETGGTASTWMAAPGDMDAPSRAEPEKPGEWSEEFLIAAASRGVRWRQVGGRLVPADGSLEYGPTGRLIRCGGLVLADELHAANDNEADDGDGDDVEDDGVADLVEIIGRSLHESESVNRGRRHGNRVFAGSIVGVLHRTQKDRAGRDRVVVLTEPRNADGRYRPRTSKAPPPHCHASPDDVIDAKRALAWAIPRMSPGSILVLDLALQAENLRQIGELLGKVGKNAERVGKQALIDACADLQSATTTEEQHQAA
jgi:hypothetical protein